MSYRGIPQYSQGYPQITPQAGLGSNQSSKNKRNTIGRQPGNNLGIQPVTISNPYGDLTSQQPALTQQQAPGLQIPQPPSQQTVQYFVPHSSQPLQQPQQFNRIQNQPPVYPQFMQSGYSYPIYQNKNIVSGMQPNSSDQSILGQHQMHQPLTQPSHLQQITPQAPTFQQHLQPMPQRPQHSQDQMMYQAPYSKVQNDYIQMQQPKIGIRQIENKPIMQTPSHHHPPAPSQQLINYQQSTIQHQQMQQPQQRIEPSMAAPVSTFIPDYNSPPIGPFNIIGRGNLPTINFVYSSEDL